MQIKRSDQNLSSYTLLTSLAAQAGLLVPHLLQRGNYHLRALKVNKESASVRCLESVIASVANPNTFSNNLWVCPAFPFAICPSCVQTLFLLAHAACFCCFGARELPMKLPPCC